MSSQGGTAATSYLSTGGRLMDPPRDDLVEGFEVSVLQGDGAHIGGDREGRDILQERSLLGRP